MNNYNYNKYKYKFIKSIFYDIQDKQIKYFGKCLKYSNNFNLFYSDKNIEQFGGTNKLTHENILEIEHKIKKILLSIYDENIVDNIFLEYNEQQKKNSNLVNSHLSNLTIDEFIGKIIWTIYNNQEIVDEIKSSIMEKIESLKSKSKCIL